MTSLMTTTPKSTGTTADKMSSSSSNGDLGATPLRELQLRGFLQHHRARSGSIHDECQPHQGGSMNDTIMMTINQEVATTPKPQPRQQQQQQYQQPQLQHKLGGGDVDLVGVLRQVSEMTMGDPRILGTPRMSSTPPTKPPPMKTAVLQTPESANYTPEISHKFLPPHDTKRKSSPRFSGRKKCKSSALGVALHAAPAAPDARVFNAPPLPSSPELSVGGMNHRRATIPPQFSPIATFRLSAPHAGTGLPPSLPLTNALQEAVQRQSPSPRAPPPPPSVANPPEELSSPPPAPPAMPWMDTPETAGPKRVIAMNQLKMRRRNHSPGSGASGGLASLSFCG